MTPEARLAVEQGGAVLPWTTRSDDRPRAPKGIGAQRHGRRDYILRRVLAIADLVAIGTGLTVALAVTGTTAPMPTQLLWSVVTAPVWLVLFKLYGLYDRDAKRISHTTVDDIPSLLHALLIGSIMLWLYFDLLGPGKLLFQQILLFGCLTMALTITFRAASRGSLTRMGSAERVLLVGEADITGTLVRKMQSHPEYALEPVGLVIPDGCLPGTSPLPVLGGIDELPALVDHHDIDRIILSPGQIDQHQVMDLLYRCKQLSRKVSLLPSVSDAMGPSTEIDDLEGVTVLGINPPVLARSSRTIKRTLDLFGVGVALVLTAPLVLLIALAIKLDSRGPVLFRQQRVGKGGRRFGLVKFRTMVPDAEQRREELVAQSSDPHWLKVERDPRITRVGRLLRMTSADELPQLWNVLRGEMSLVGPRPLIESEDQLVEGWARGRLDLTPGITGYWQVLGRTIIPFAEMVKLDYLYVTNWSLWTDIRLILRTLPVVLTRRGAN
jgi:exopolysaccharide biosynthesis polyprenyl glycosylphosphotransferase